MKRQCYIDHNDTERLQRTQTELEERRLVTYCIVDYIY